MSSFGEKQPNVRIAPSDPFSASCVIPPRHACAFLYGRHGLRTRSVSYSLRERSGPVWFSSSNSPGPSGGAGGWLKQTLVDILFFHPCRYSTPQRTPT